MSVVAVCAMLLGIPAQHDHAAPQAAGLQVPSAIKAEHQELHAQLAEAMKAPGTVGKAAEEVGKALRPHFEAEEQYALPPLGALQALAGGTATADLRPAIEKAAWLKANMHRMLEEHKTIVAALDKLAAAAKAENRPEQLEFAEALKHHAAFEEQILYPAAIVAGALAESRIKN